MIPIILPDYPRDTQEWYAARARSIGASEIAMALGCSRYGGLCDLVTRKREALAGRFDDSDSDQLAEGRAYESAIVAVVARRLRTRPEFADLSSMFVTAPAPSYAHPDEPRLTATPDGVLVSTTSSNPVVDGVLETKRDRSGADWKEVAKYGWDSVPAGDLRLQYLIQVQTQILVTGARFGLLAVHTGFDTHVIRVAPDPAMHAVILAAVPTVWRWIEEPTGALPPLDACDSDAAVNARLRGRQDATETPPEHVADAIRAYASASAALKPLEAAKATASAVVRRYYTETDAKRLATADGYAANLVVMPPAQRFDLTAALANPDLAPILSQYITHEDRAAQVRITAPKGKGSKS